MTPQDADRKEDGRERGPRRPDEREAGQQDERRNDDDAAADAEQPGENAGREADENEPRSVHARDYIRFVAWLQ